MNFENFVLFRHLFFGTLFLKNSVNLSFSGRFYRVYDGQLLGVA